MLKFEFEVDLRDPRYDCFDPVYKCNIVMNGDIWPSAAHYYQAQKFPHDKMLQDAIRKCDDVKYLYKIVAANRKLVRSDFEYIKYNVMLEAMMAKFVQGAGLRDMLLSTGHRKFISSSKDKFWGNGCRGEGQKKLISILTVIRHTFQSVHDPLGVVFPK